MDIFKHEIPKLTPIKLVFGYVVYFGASSNKKYDSSKNFNFYGSSMDKNCVLLGFNSIFRLYQIFKLKFDYKGVRYGFSNIDTRERAYSKLSKKHSKLQIRTWEDPQNLGYVLR